MKGIVLAGGHGTRLRPLTSLVSKQMLPIFDKPLINYPISVLMLAGIREIAIISSKEHIDGYQNYFGDGSQVGLSIDYIIQDNPNGIAESFILAESFIKDHPVALILGDNIFYGPGLSEMLHRSAKIEAISTVFVKSVADPDRFGVLQINEHGVPIDIIEKPQSFISDLAVTGLYFYPNSVINIAKSLKPSQRGELEITDVNKIYLQEKSLRFEKLNRGFVWMDAGTHESLLTASNFVKNTQDLTGYLIGCLEEIAYNNGWITKEELLKATYYFKNSHIGSYLERLHASK